MNKEGYKEYIIPGGKYGIDDLKDIYAFRYDATGEHDRTNDVLAYKDSEGWLGVSPLFKDIDYLDQKAVNKLSKKLAKDNELYIRSLKKSGKFGQKLPDTSLLIKPVPLYDDHYRGRKNPVTDKPVESYRFTFIGEDENKTLVDSKFVKDNE